MNVFFSPHPPLAVPAVGGGNERQIEPTLAGYRRMAEEIAAIKPETIIFITPHGNAFREALAFLEDEKVSGDFGMFGHNEEATEKRVNLELTEEIMTGLRDKDITVVGLNQSSQGQYGVRIHLDHGVLVPMYYIDRLYKDYSIVHMTSSFASAKVHYEAGKLMDRVVGNRSVVMVASGDLSHALKEEGLYSYNPYGPVFDGLVREAIEVGDPAKLLDLNDGEIEAAAQCGLRSFCLGFGVMDGKTYESQVYSYEGPFGVGYLTGALRGE